MRPDRRKKDQHLKDLLNEKKETSKQLAYYNDMLKEPVNTRLIATEDIYAEKEACESYLETLDQKINNILYD